MVFISFFIAPFAAKTIWMERQRSAYYGSYASGAFSIHSPSSPWLWGFAGCSVQYWRKEKWNKRSKQTDRFPGLTHPVNVYRESQNIKLHSGWWRENNTNAVQNQSETQNRVSEIGLGSAYMPQTPLKEAIPALRQAYEGVINYYDLAAGLPKLRCSSLCSNHLFTHSAEYK